MFFGRCLACDAEGDGAPDELGDLYCHQCWEFHEASHYRCLTVCAIYDTRGARLSVATSIKGCAERAALAKLDPDKLLVPKTAVVARIRKNTSGRRATFGDSKPCTYCLIDLRRHNVQRVGYSVLDAPCRSMSDSASSFAWEDTDAVRTTLRTKSDAQVHPWLEGAPACAEGRSAQT